MDRGERTAVFCCELSNSGGQVDGDQDDRKHNDHHERSWSLGDKDRLQHPDWVSSGWEHGWREPDGHDSRTDKTGKGGRDDHDQSSHWPSGPEDLGNYHYTYDAAGNVTDDGQRTYTWDAAHRLISVTDKTTGHLSQFTYDGFSRLTVRKEYTSADASPTETHYLWCGDFICQTRDASDTITARYYSQGELQGNAALYYNANHLGSVIGLLDDQGKSLGQTSYGPYGEPEQTQGKTSDYRYAGMYYHASTGLYLTHYRFYDPQSGRWLNWDSIGYNGGVNLYAYINGKVLNHIDFLGLAGVLGIHSSTSGKGPSSLLGLADGHSCVTYSQDGLIDPAK